MPRNTSTIKKPARKGKATTNGKRPGRPRTTPEITATQYRQILALRAKGVGWDTIRGQVDFAYGPDQEIRRMAQERGDSVRAPKKSPAQPKAQASAVQPKAQVSGNGRRKRVAKVEVEAANEAPKRKRGRPRKAAQDPQSA